MYFIRSTIGGFTINVPVSDAAIGTVELDEIEERRHAPVRRRLHLDGAPPHRANRLPHKVHVHLLRVFLQLRQDLLTGIETTWFSSEIRTKLRDWAVGQAGGSCYSRAALSSNDSKTLYITQLSFCRALGTVCCVLEGIMELEEAGGIQILSDTLRGDAEGATEEEKSEAAGLLAQGRHSIDILNDQVW